MEIDFTFYKYEIALLDSNGISVELEKIFTIDDTNLEPIKVNDKVIGIKKLRKRKNQTDSMHFL